MGRAESFRDDPCVSRFIQFGTVKNSAECIELRARQEFAGGAYDGRRINPPGKEGADRDVAPEPQAHRFLETRPDFRDRILGLDTLYVNTIAALILFGMYLRSSVFFEAALVIAMLGFVGTVMLSKYVLRRDIVE